MSFVWSWRDWWEFAFQNIELEELFDLVVQWWSTSWDNISFCKKINRVYYFRSLLTQLLLIAYFDWTWSLRSFFVECVVSEFCKDEFAESQLHQQQQQQQVRHRGALQCRRLRSPIPEYGTLYRSIYWSLPDSWVLWRLLWMIFYCMKLYCKWASLFREDLKYVYTRK